MKKIYNLMIHIDSKVKYLHMKVGDLILLFLFLNVLVGARIIFAFKIIHLIYFIIMNRYIIKFIKVKLE